MRVYDDTWMRGRLKKCHEMTNYQKIQDGRHIENLTIFTINGGHFVFFWKFWFFSCYLPFQSTAHPRIHIIRYLTYWFCPFILDIVAYSCFGEKIVRHFGFMLIWDISFLNNIYFKSVLHWGGGGGLGTTIHQRSITP